MTPDLVPVGVGWQFAPPQPDPGPPPARPQSASALPLDPGWVAAQRNIAGILARPARLGAAGCALAAGLIGAVWSAGLLGQVLAGPGILLAATGATACARSVVRARQRLGDGIAAERSRVAAESAAHARRLASAQREHAVGYRAWQRRIAVYERQQVWFEVTLPAGIDRLDVAGGTLAGWSAMLTMIAAPRLDCGAEVTVVDLTEGAVAGELVSLAQRSGIRPLVWVLPDDLPQLDLGSGLDRHSLADVLAVAAAAAAGLDGDCGGGGAGSRAGADVAADCALLERVLAVLPPDPLIAQVTAALRALAEVGDPRAEVSSGLLTASQLDQVGRLFGRGASERLVIERAFVLESRLRRLDWLGAGRAPEMPSRLRVAALSGPGPVTGNRMLASYVVAALTQMLRQAPPGEPWAHALFLLGAERIGGDLVDRLAGACETSRTGLVLAFRSVPAGVRERLGRGNAAIAFMRLGNGDEARAASELIGTEHRFVVSQLTDSVATSQTGTRDDSYTSTVGTSESIAGSVSASRGRGSSRNRGRGHHGAPAPFGDFNRSSGRDDSHSAGQSESVSLTEGMNAATSWGLSTSQALGESFSLGRTVQRSREFLVEPDELQRLPATAMIVSYPAPAGRSVVLADANPAIGLLPGVPRPGQ